MEKTSFISQSQSKKNAVGRGGNDLLPMMIRSLSTSSSLSAATSATDSGQDDRDERWMKQKWLKYVLAWLWRKPVTEKEDQQEEKSRKNHHRRYLALAAIVTTLIAIWWHRNKQRKRGTLQVLLSMLGDTVYRHSNSFHRAKEAPLSLLWDAAKDGRIKKALLLGSQSAVAYQDQGGTWRRTTLPSQSPALQTSLLEALAEGGCTDVAALPESIWSKLATPTIAALPFVYLALLYKMMRNLHSGANDGARTYNEEASQQVTFQDIAGLEKAVTEVSEVVSYLENPVLYQQLGARPPRGILLFGPPGSGKTLLARAVAGQASCDAFLACSGSDFVESYVGRGAARIRALFEQAKTQATRNSEETWYRRLLGIKSSDTKSRPASAVIFMDEIDALAKSRSGFGGSGGNEERDQTLNQLLTELDGFASNEDTVTVIFIGATNRPDVLDPAILRRFDRRVHVGYPDASGRRAILEIHARRIHHGHLDYDHLGSDKMTKGFSGADLRNVINDAALLAVRDNSPLVEQRHVLHAIRRVQQMKQSLDHNGVRSLLSSLPIELD